MRKFDKLYNLIMEDAKATNKCMKQMNDLNNKDMWEQCYDQNFDWNDIDFYQDNKLSEDFIREFQDKVNWSFICRYQKLSEDFIREFQDKVNWYYIALNQKLSKKFIREFQIDSKMLFEYYRYRDYNLN